MTGASLSAANTLALPSAADRVVEIVRERDLHELVDSLRNRSDAQAHAPPLTVLGGGSNVVLRPQVPGVVCLMRTRGVRFEADAGNTVRITAAAGERWHDLVRYALGQGLWGLENLALIPGAVGAAPIQNIGAYGVELSDRFVSLRALDTTSGEVREFDGAACRFGYRNSYFKTAEAAPLVILDVTLRLTQRGEPVTDYPDLQVELSRLGCLRPNAIDVAEAVIRIRRRKLPDPRFVGNVGSFFKNPVLTAEEALDVARRHPDLARRPGASGTVKLSAAQLIERCGWKGRSLGSVGVWHRQPLVLINRGGATAADVLALSENIRRDVADHFGVRLELEPRVLGQD